MKQRKRRFTPEFKAEAVKLWEDSGQKIKVIAEQLGITPQMLRQWQREKTNPARCPITQATGSSSLTAAELAAENLRLRKENARLKMDQEISKKNSGHHLGDAKMIFSSIDQHRDQWPVRRQCRVLGVSASGFYAWRNRQPSKRSVANQNLLSHIRRIHWDSRKLYGSPRVHAALRAEGQNVSRKRVEKLMRQNNLAAMSKRRVRVVTTDSKHNLPIAPNVLDRNFAALAPNEKWLADITYIPTDEGWLYLAAILDLFSRKIVGWSMRDHMRTELVSTALMMAVQRQRPKAGLIHHSDRGSQYAAGDYQDALATAGMTPSMSRKANCWDNAPMESFFHTLKTELVHQRHYATREEARRDLFQYIEGYYNRQRIHSAINYLTPEQMELNAA